MNKNLNLPGAEAPLCRQHSSTAPRVHNTGALFFFIHGVQSCFPGIFHTLPPETHTRRGRSGQENWQKTSKYTLKTRLVDRQTGLIDCLRRCTVTHGHSPNTTQAKPRTPQQPAAKTPDTNKASLFCQPPSLWLIQLPPCLLHHPHPSNLLPSKGALIPWAVTQPRHPPAQV